MAFRLPSFALALNAPVSPRSSGPSAGSIPSPRQSAGRSRTGRKQAVPIPTSKSSDMYANFRTYWTQVSRVSGKMPERSLAMRNPHVIVRHAHTVPQQPASALIELGASPDFARKMVELGKTAADVCALMDAAGVPASERSALLKAYSDKNLIVSNETVVRGLTDEAVARDDTGEPKIERLQEGRRHSVFRVECRAGETEKPRILAFKVLEDIDFSTPTTMAHTGPIAGIDEFDPQLAMRNFASRNVCDLLGFDVIVKGEIGYFTVEPGGAPTLGIAMDWAEGHPGVETGPVVMNDPAIMRELAKLQLVDQLTGQNDRHKLNYLVDWNTSTVMGIDNDICFGTQSRAERLPMAPNTSFPLYIDTDMAVAVERLTREALKTALDGKLLDEEIEMTLARLDCVKAAVTRRQAEGRVISPNEWGAPKVRADMMARQFDTYWGRDQAGGITIENVRNELTDATIYML